MADLRCPECTATVEQGDRFCRVCAAPLDTVNQSAVEEPETGPIGGGERRQVTTLFADLVGSTPLAEEIGEEALFNLMQTVIGEMTQAVRTHGGTVEKLTGDGLMAIFGAPLAVEDAPLNACRAGLDILARMGVGGESLTAGKGPRPQIRIGINTGYAVIADLGSDLQQEITALGDSVNVAARLEGLAEPGTAVIGEATYRLVSGYIEAEFAGEHPVKGKSEPQRIWRLNAVKSGIRRFDISLRHGLTTLVGRRAELERVLDLHKVSEAGTCQVIDIIGDAGLGKSRLVYEFRQQLSDENITWLQGNCTVSGRSVPFLPFIEVVRSSFGIIEDADRSAVERRLRRGIEVLGLNPAEGVPYLLNLLGFKVAGSEFTKEHAEVAGIRTRDLLYRLLIERARVAPTILHIDDLHWMDTASEALLRRMIEGAGELPLLFLFTYRPEYESPWVGETNATALRLAPLSANSTAELLRYRLNVDDLPAELTRLVTEKAEGNPLFAEEIVNYLSERGGLNGDATGLPISLENLLMARVDRLDEAPKRLLQGAAVIGRSFNLNVVSEVADLDGRAAAAVAELERLELVRPDTAPGEYMFKHALIQDAVYGSLLSDHLQVLHERAADAIERRHRHRLGEIVETLAHHYEQTSRTEKAVLYMAQAGEKSLRVYSLDEAELRLRQVVELTKQVPDCADDAFLVDVLLNLARIQYFRADMFGLLELLEPHLPKAEAIGDPIRLGRFLFEIGYAHVFAGDIRAGFPVLERAKEIGENSGDELITGYAALGLLWGYIAFEAKTAGWMDRIVDLSGEAERIGRKFGDNWLTAKAITGMCISNNLGGRPGEANRHALRLFDFSRETDDPRARSMGLWALAINDSTHFAFDEAIESGREGSRLALSVVDRSLAEAYMAVALVMQGRTMEGRPRLAEIVNLFHERGFRIALTGCAPYLGVAMVLDGEMAEGIRWIEEYMERFSGWGAESSVATCHLTLGEIYTRMAIDEERPPMGVMLRNFGFLLRTLPRVKALARRHLETALADFRAADMPSYVAWALLDLALLDRKQGRADEAEAKFEEAFALARSVEATGIIDLIEDARR